MDPSLYISRFAALLEFQDETQKVAHDATRLVQRFSRDWMDTGRRPAGICGACLLLAARMNNFRRSVEEIVQVVKIADTTLKKRLDEFKATASGGLSITEFRSMWLEETHDPPAYTTSVRKIKRSTSELLDDDADRAETSSQGAERSRSRSRSTSAAPASSRKGRDKGKGREVTSLDPLPEEGTPGPLSLRPAASGDADGAAVFQTAADFDDGAGALADEGESMIDPSLIGSPAGGRNATLPASSSVAGSTWGGEEAADEAAEKDGQEKAEREKDETDSLDGKRGEKGDGAADAAITGELDTYLSSTQAQLLSTELTEAERRREERRQMATGDLDDLDDAELDGFLLTEEEVQVKTRVWMEYNKDYLEKLARASSHTPFRSAHPSADGLLPLTYPDWLQSGRPRRTARPATGQRRRARSGQTPTLAGRRRPSRPRTSSRRSFRARLTTTPLTSSLSRQTCRSGCRALSSGTARVRTATTRMTWPRTARRRPTVSRAAFAELGRDADSYRTPPCAGNEDDDEELLPVIEENSDDEVRHPPSRGRLLLSLLTRRRP